jgi:SAM-dependent methyltransferase
MPEGTSKRTLKTDLFDEAVTDGLYPILAERSAAVVGLDVAPAVLVAARRKYAALDVVGADVRSLPFERDSMDCVVSLSTLDHFDAREDIRVALGELHRVLRPGGVLILTLDNLANPVVALRNALPYALTHGVGLVPYPMGKTHGPASAREIVQESGFEVRECTTVMHAPRVFAIPVMNVLGSGTMPRTQRILSRIAMSFEAMQRLPSWKVTGHFVAIRALKR